MPGTNILPLVLSRHIDRSKNPTNESNAARRDGGINGQQKISRGGFYNLYKLFLRRQTWDTVLGHSVKQVLLIHFLL